VLLGEAGIGKTRLVEELAVRAARRGGRVAVGRCYETEQILPFAPWVAAFRSAGMLADAALVEALPLPVRQTLARLFPAVIPPGIPAAQEPENALRLFEALSHVAALLAARAPLLVVLEDLHWADDMTLRFLAFFGRRLPPDVPLLVVGTAREEDIVQAPALRRTLDELASHEAFASLAVGALTSAQTASLVRALTRVGAAEPAVADIAAKVWRSSEGNPFVAVETTRAIEEGLPAAAGEGVAVPGSVRDLIVRRLEHLTPRARQVAAVAAVASGPLDFTLIQRASGLSRAEAAEGLEELVRQRVFHGVGPGFDFTHDRVRHVAHAGLLAPRRDVLHAAIAEALESLHEGAAAPSYDRLAYHYARTDRSEKAVEYLARFAGQAARAFAHADAAAALEQALVHGERLPAAARDVRLVELSLRLAFSLSLLGRFRDILTILGGYRARVDRLERPDLAGPYHFRLGLTHAYLNEQARAAESGRAALEHARRAGDATTMGRAHYLLALTSYWTGAPGDGVAHAREAVRLMEGSDDRHYHGLSYWILGLNHLLLGEFEASLAAARELWRIGRALNDPRLQTFAAGSIGWTHATRGDADAGVAASAEALELARDPVSHAIALGQLGYAYAARGDAAAIEMFERSITELRRLDLRHLVSRTMVWVAEAHLDHDDPKAARRVAEEALAQGADYWFAAASAARALARVAFGEGDVVTGERHLAASLETFGRAGAAFEVGRTHLLVAETLEKRGERARAQRHLAEAATWLTAVDAPVYHARLRAAR
jgi:tetratricopeptide (TPR) repeat protein